MRSKRATTGATESEVENSPSICCERLNLKHKVGSGSPVRTVPSFGVVVVVVVGKLR